MSDPIASADSTTDESTPSSVHVPASNQRRKLFIHPRLQTRLMRDCCTAPMVGFATGMLVLCFLIGMVRAEADEANVILASLDKLVAAMLMFITACLTVVIYHGLRFSHRIAGPLYRFRVTLDRVLAGESDLEIRLRKGDYMHGLAAHLNEVIQSIAQRDAEIARLRGEAGNVPVDTASTTQAASVDDIAAPPTATATESNLRERDPACMAED